MAIKAFELFGEISLKGDTATLSGLKGISAQVDTTSKDLGKLRSAFDETAKSHSDFNKGFLASFGIQGGGSLTSMLGSAAGNLLQGGAKALYGSVKDAAQQGLEYADMLQKAKIGFETVLGSKELAVAHVRELFQYGADSAFETKDVLNYAQSLEALGVKSKEVIPIIQALGDAASSMGHFDKMPEVVDAITRMLSRNRIDLVDMNRGLAANVPDPWGMMQRGFKAAGVDISREDLMKKAETDQLNAATALRLMFVEMEKERGGMLEKVVGGTIEGQMARLNDARQMLYAEGMMGVTDIAADPAPNSAFATKLKNIQTLQTLYDPKQSPQAMKIAQNLGAGASNVFKVEDFLESQTFASDNFGDLIRAGVTGDWSKAEESFKKMSTTLGGWIPEGLKQGISTGIGAAAGAAKDLGTGLYDAMNSFWQWGSPSKKAIEMGVGVGDGMRIGLLASLEALAQDPRVKAMLDVIGFSEGTDKKFGYATKVGGSNQGSLASKNRSVVNLGGGLKSSASGRYQFLNSTWDNVASQLGLEDFSAHSQDLAAVKLLQDSGAIDKLQSGDFKGAVNAAKKIWASFPGAGYGQGEKSLSSLSSVYQNSLNVGGSPVTATNPIPVAIVAAASSSSDGLQWQKWKPSTFGGPDFNNAGNIFRAGMVQKAKTIGGGSIDAGTIYDSGGLITQDPLMMLNESALMLKKPLDLLTVSADNAAKSLDPFKAVIDEFGNPLKEGKAKKAKKDKLFDAAFTKEGVAGDFENSFSQLLSGLGHDKPMNLLKSFGMNLLQDIQGRIAHDISAQLTGALFGNRGEDGKLSGGLLGGLFGGNGGGGILSMFGSLFGGHRASGGPMNPGRLYIAGEHGPEAIWMGNQSGYAAGYGNQNAATEHRTLVVFSREEAGRAMSDWGGSGKGRRTHVMQAKYMRKVSNAYYA